MTRSAVLLDLDGTLVDTNYLHVLAWSRAFAELGQEVPMVDLHRLIGMGSDQLVVRILGHDSQAAAAAHDRHFQPLLGDARALPGAADLLRGLAAGGAQVVLATSAKAEDLAALRRLIDADDAIDEVVSSADVENSKPAPDIFAVARERAGVERSRAIAVGDTIWDIEAAGRCEIGCVAVLTGGIGAAELRAAGALQVCADAAELARSLDSGPIGALLT